ncbi:lipopolysaccharide biosynthesis protein [Sphingobacterium sp. HJSM2_6]|uniref:lipopolysaccharide biosynthesis protein n=1 Tax=Sphingobacterium sp. HJSM2_6 TaxID=3366264 RepID=UPI003BBC315A
MNTIVRHTIIYFLGKGIPGLISFISVLIFSRFLNAKEYGVYSLIVSLAGIINIIFFDWLRYGLTRFYPEFKVNNEENKFIGFLHITVFYNIILLAFIFVLYYCFDKFLILENQFSTYIHYIFFIAVLQYLFTIYSQLFVSNLEPLKYSYANILKTVLTLIVGLTLIMNGMNYIGLLIGSSIGFLISVIYAFTQIPFKNVKLDFQKQIFKNLINYALPLTASAGLSFLLSYSSRFIISYFRGVEETGLYSLGFDFSQQSIGVFIAIAATSATPIAMKIYSQEGKSVGLIKHFNQSLQLLLIVALPILIIFLSCSVDLQSFFLGNNFSKLDRLVLPLVSLSAFILGLKSYYLDLFFYIKKESKYQLFILIFVATLNVILNFIFIPSFGYVSALWISLIVNFLAVIFTYIIVQKIFPIQINYREILKILTISVVMFIVIMIFGNSSNIFMFFIKIGLSIFVYGSLMVYFNKNIKNQISKFLKRQ